MGITQWRRVPALNTDPTFIGDLAALVVDKLPACAPRPGWEAPLAGGEGDSLGPPTGTVQAVLKTYDRARRTLPLPSLSARWQWGWTRSAETWNGRLAMVAILALLLAEVATGQGALARWLSVS